MDLPSKLEFKFAPRLCIVQPIKKAHSPNLVDYPLGLGLPSAAPYPFYVYLLDPFRKETPSLAANPAMAKIRGKSLFGPFI